LVKKTELLWRQLALAGLIILASYGAGANELLIIRDDGVVLRYALEIADTEKARETGLMHREFLASQSGMLFDFGSPVRIRMWMKNTLIPLDMLFASHSGRIVHIARDATPHSEALIESPMVARYVFEINGGEAERLNIRPGAKLVIADR